MQINELNTRFFKGYSLLLEEILHVAEARSQKPNLLPYRFDEKVMKTIKDDSDVKKKLEEGSDLLEFLGLGDEALLTLYETAVNLLEYNKNEEASHAFFFLTILSPSYVAFWQGLARSEAKLNNTEKALAAYKAALMTDQNNADLFSEAIRYALEIKNGKSVEEFLNLAIELDEDHPGVVENEELRQSAISLKNELSWIINQ